MKIINIYEITPNGECLTLKSRQNVLDAYFKDTKAKIVFNAGTSYTKPESILAEIRKNDFLLLCRESDVKNYVVLMKWNKEIKMTLKNNNGRSAYALLSELCERNMPSQ